MKTKRTFALLPVLVLALSACGSGASRQNPFDGASPRGSAGETEIRVEIQNLSFNDIAVWAVRPGGQRRRVARVTGKTDQTATISWNVALPISFFVEQTAGQSCRTVAIAVEAGARVWLNVPGNVGAQQCRAGRR